MNEIEIYKTPDNRTEIEVVFDNDTVWLSQKQLAILFQNTVPNINMHVKNIYKEKELLKNPTIKKSLIVQKEGKRNVKREVELYNLDVIISVGYRVKSKRGTQFRQWATQRLKDYLVKGYAINEKRLQETQTQLTALKQTIRLLSEVTKAKKVSGNEAAGLLKVLNDYSISLDILDKYDHQTLRIKKSKSTEVFRITYKEAKRAVEGLQNKFGGSALFGKEKDKSFTGSIEAIYQTFDGKEVYPSIEEKAAHLLYFVIKNHSFTDGNKRIAAFLFVWFLERNNLLYYQNKKLIDDNALVALALLIAASKPDDKDIMVKVLVNLLNNK